MSQAEYEARSVRAVTTSWLEYEAQSHDSILSGYQQPRAYFVDGDLVVAITEETRSRFVTCYHEHFYSRRALHGNNPGNTASLAQRRLRYLENLRYKEKGGVIINLRIIRDAQPPK
jgi:hypothetical protein